MVRVARPRVWRGLWRTRGAALAGLGLVWVSCTDSNAPKLVCSKRPPKEIGTERERAVSVAPPPRRSRRRRRQTRKRARDSKFVVSPAAPPASLSAPPRATHDTPPPLSRQQRRRHITILRCAARGARLVPRVPRQPQLVAHAPRRRLVPRPRLRRARAQLELGYPVAAMAPRAHRTPAECRITVLRLVAAAERAVPPAPLRRGGRRRRRRRRGRRHG